MNNRGWNDSMLGRILRKEGEINGMRLRNLKREERVFFISCKMSDNRKKPKRENKPDEDEDQTANHHNKKGLPC